MLAGLFAAARTRLAAALDAALIGPERLTEGAVGRIEEALLAADVGPETAAAWTERLRRRSAEGGLDPAEARRILREEATARLGSPPPLALPTRGLGVVLVVGTNGSGKTTTAAKIAARMRREGRRPLLAAADTYRAAGAAQLEIWAGRIGVDCVGGAPNADPASVAFDACAAADARGADVVVVDTAGRLHNRADLMAEVAKVARVVSKRVPGAPHETLLVLDATNGRNALRQIEEFGRSVPLTGLVLAKADAAARGGALIDAASRGGPPVRFIGTGEGAEDLSPFDPAAFAAALVGDA